MDFCQSVKKHFHFLETHYDCDLESSQLEDWGGEVVYLNKTTGVKLTYEFSNAFIFVFICKLVNGKIVDNTQPINKDSKIYCFDLNDALPENEKMKPAYHYDVGYGFHNELDGLSNYVKQFASRLEKYGDHILKGDFSILSKMEQIIKNRACSHF